MTTADTAPAMTFTEPGPVATPPAEKPTHSIEPDTTAPTVDEAGRYSNDAWKRVTAAIGQADAAVLEAREAKRLADLAYGIALQKQAEEQQRRDTMIISDPRTSTEISRLAGVTRTRVVQIRRRGGAEPAVSCPHYASPEARRLIYMLGPSKPGSAGRSGK